MLTGDCQGKITLTTGGESKQLRNPKYPDNTPAEPGLHCKWNVTNPNHDDGYILVLFREVNTPNERFNLTHSGKSWVFDGNNGLESLIVENTDWLLVRYDCRKGKTSDRFNIEVKWRPYPNDALQLSTNGK